MVELAHRLNGLDLELDAKVGQVGADLLEKLLDLVFVASFQECGDRKGRN